jgi:hypothetical protein
MAVTLVDSGVAAQTVVIVFAVDIPDMDAGTPGQDDGKRMIVMCAIPLL